MTTPIETPDKDISLLREALEEAAKVADRYVMKANVAFEAVNDDHGKDRNAARARYAQHIADDIRALSATAGKP